MQSDGQGFAVLEFSEIPGKLGKGDANIVLLAKLKVDSWRVSG